MLSLMYYSIKGKMFLYNYTKIKLKLDNNTSISIFGNVLIKDINRDKVTSFQQIFNLSNLNSEIKATLTEIKNCFYNGKFSLYKLYYLVIYSDSYRSCVFGIFNLNCTKIILSMLYNHKLLCKTNKKCMICSKLNEKNENNLFSFSTLFFEIDKSDGKINKKRKFFRFNAESYVLFNKRKNVFI